MRLLERTDALRQHADERVVGSVESDRLADQIRSQPQHAAGAHPTLAADERARTEAEASKQETLAAAYRELCTHAESGYLVIPAGLPALEPDFLHRHEQLVRVASAANRIVHRQH